MSLSLFPAKVYKVVLWLGGLLPMDEPMFATTTAELASLKHNAPKALLIWNTLIVASAEYEKGLRGR